MEKRLSRFMLFLLLCSLIMPVLSFVSTPRVNGAEQIFFEDSFDDYETGTFPSSSGWELWYSGAGTEQQIIVSNASVSSTNSLKLRGLDGWAAFAAKRFTSRSQVIGFEVAVKVEETNNRSRDNARVSFTKKLSSSISREYAPVTFQDDGKIVSGGQVLQSYVADTWYKIRLIMNRDNETYSVWVNGELKGENLTVTTTSGSTSDYPSYGIEAFSVSQCYNGVTAYFDDVKIFSFFEANPRLELVPDNGIAATTLVGSGFAPNSQISVTWDGIAVPTVPSPLVTDDYGNLNIDFQSQTPTTVSDGYPKTQETTNYEQDKTGNTIATEELSEQPNQYQELPEFPYGILLTLFLIATTATIAVRKRISRPALTRITSNIHRILKLNRHHH